VGGEERGKGGGGEELTLAIPILTTAKAVVALTMASTTAASLDFLREAPGCRVSDESESRKGRGFSDGDGESVAGENRRGGFSSLGVDSGGETAAETTLK
jgi:hypothetical protein